MEPAIHSLEDALNPISNNTEPCSDGDLSHYYDTCTEGYCIGTPVFAIKQTNATFKEHANKIQEYAQIQMQKMEHLALMEIIALLLMPVMMEYVYPELQLPALLSINATKLVFAMSTQEIAPIHYHPIVNLVTIVTNVLKQILVQKEFVLDIIQ